MKKMQEIEKIKKSFQSPVFSCFFDGFCGKMWEKDESGKKSDESANGNNKNRQIVTFAN